MGTTKTSRRDREEAIQRLREWVKPGATLYTVIRHRAPSGMLRVISVLMADGGDVRDLSYHVAQATGYTYDDDKRGVRMRGAGMDMAFALVYDLARTLYPTPEGQPEPTSRNATTGGYCLKQRAL